MKTYGYDYVFALDADAVNEILQRNLAGVDQTISYTASDPAGGSTVTLNATLAPWKVVPGGQNTLINLSLPISKGTLSLSGAISGSYDLAGVAPEVQVSLGWVGAGSQQAQTGSGDLTHMIWNPQDTSKDDPGWVATILIEDPAHKLDTIAAAVLRELMASALVANRNQVAYIFANVNPRPGPLASWLTPAKWQYFWDQGAGPGGALCFLCMLNQSVAFPGQAAFDPSALQAGTDAVLLISQPSFFANVLLPSVRHTFPSGVFQLATVGEGSSSITAVGGFDLGSVHANSYSLRASPAGDGLTIACAGGGPLKFLFGLGELPNASYDWSISTINPLTFDGRNVSFASDPHPTIHQDQTIHWYDWVLLAVLGITTAVGLAAAIAALVMRFDDQAQIVGMATINSSLQAATGGAIVNAADILDWSNGHEAMQPKAAGMSESIYLAGNLLRASS